MACIIRGLLNSQGEKKSNFRDLVAAQIVDSHGHFPVVLCLAIDWWRGIYCIM